MKNWQTLINDINSRQQHAYRLCIDVDGELLLIKGYKPACFDSAEFHTHKRKEMLNYLLELRDNENVRNSRT